MEVLFSSLAGGTALHRRVLRVLDDALATGQSRRIDIHIMTFSFTDETIASALRQVAASHPNITIRIIADWRQGAPAAGHRVRDLERAGLSNLGVRYTHDQPYRWDVHRARLRWSYQSSRGLLHHKTLSVLIDGEPWQLACGSFNWTSKARESYENLLIVGAKTREERELMRAVEREFEAMWCDGRITLSGEEARAHYLKILDEFRNNPTMSSMAVTGISAGRDVVLGVLRSTGESDANQSVSVSPEHTLHIAFSSRGSFSAGGTRGHSPHNANRRFALHKPSGKVKDVPLTLSTLALDVIARARTGETLKVAMYALSARVPEYGALLDAARRGVHLQVLLDAAIGVTIHPQLAGAAQREHLPIEARFANRTMHQKYIVHPELLSVLTGTTNLSTDSSLRHSEQRLLIRDNAALVDSFLNDFNTMWARADRTPPVLLSNAAG
jgi:phosphatidylserine/phosphatidylglycerophosphate/cardiolipin synthase-like enzyme